TAVRSLEPARLGGADRGAGCVRGLWKIHTMSSRYRPGPAAAALTSKEGENWTFVLERNLRHPPEKVWDALTDPAHLGRWAPFDADGNLGVAGSTVTLTT